MAQRTQETMNSYMNRIFQERVLISKALRRDSKAKTKRVVDRLLQRVNEKDSRFGRDALCIGSSYQGLKITEPNEYDYNIPFYLTFPATLESRGERPRRYSFAPPYSGKEMTLASVPDDCHVVSMGSQFMCLSSSLTSVGCLPSPHLKNVGYCFVHSVVKTISEMAPEYRKIVGSSGRFWCPEVAYREGSYCDVARNNDVIPFLVRRRLHRLLASALQELNMQGLCLYFPYLYTNIND